MSGLKIYGRMPSRVYRTLWMAKELELEYEQVPLHQSDGSTRTPEYLAINPNGEIPAIDDDGLVLWESMAINLYLAKKYGGPLAPETLEEEARATQWSFWVMSQVETPLLTVLMHRVLLPENQRNEGLVLEKIESLQKPFHVLDSVLKKSEYLLGDRFTVADLNVASVLRWTTMASVELLTTPDLATWLNHCLSRPAATQ